jgi:TonB family protein
MHKLKDKDDFLKLPIYPGGKKELREFISQNLKYPELAIKNKIEGDVVVDYQVDGLGDILDARVKRGIGFDCDEEAIRLVKLLKFEKTRNRGVRLIATNHITIRFRLPNTGIQLNYSISMSEPSESKNKPDVYGYIIKL